MLLELNNKASIFELHSLAERWLNDTVKNTEFNDFFYLELSKNLPGAESHLWQTYNFVLSGSFGLN